LAGAEEVESEDLIDEHLGAVLLGQVEVVTLPLGIPLNYGRWDVLAFVGFVLVAAVFLVLFIGVVEIRFLSVVRRLWNLHAYSERVSFRQTFPTLLAVTTFSIFTGSELEKLLVEDVFFNLSILFLEKSVK